MNDNEELAFRLVYDFYRKTRERVLETDEDWLGFAREVQELGGKLDGNQLGQNLLQAAVETVSFLYKGGRKPMPANYFGRDDL